MLYTVPILIGVTLVTFFLFHWVGGDPALQYAGKNADLQSITTLRHELGLDRSVFSQYLFYLKQTVFFDWGRSWATSQSISQMFKDGLGPTLALTVPAFLLSLGLALALSLVASYKRGFWDRTIVFSCLVLMSISFLVYIVLLQKVFAFHIGLFPIYGWDGSVKYVLLPWLVYVIATVGPKTLLFRSALLNEANKDYVRTAKAKGLGPCAIYARHILKNAVLPIVTLSFSQLPGLITGALLLEAYFGIPGLGGMLATAIHGSDFPVIKAMTVMGSLLYILCNLLNDILCGYLDPRTEYK